MSLSMRKIVLVLASACALAGGDSAKGEVKVVVPPRQSVRVALTRPEPDAPAYLLRFRARLEAARRGGYTYGLRITFNGTVLSVEQLVNKLPYEERRDGTLKNTASAGGKVFAVDYADRFVREDNHPFYSLKSGRSVFEFAFDVSRLVRPGKNEVVLENAIRPPLDNDLIVEDLRLEPVDRVQRVRAEVHRYRGAPPRWIVRPAPPCAFQLIQTSDRTLRIKVADAVYECRSFFSIPEGKWVSGSNAYFEHRRQVTRAQEAIIVRDTFVNRTRQDLPLIQRHELRVVGDQGQNAHEWMRVWVAGLNPANRTGAQSEPANPTTFGTTLTAGIGLLPLNDVFLVHTRNIAEPARLLLEDPFFVLAAGATYTAEWALVPVDRATVTEPWRAVGGDEAYVWKHTNEPYFAFVNAVRRLRDVNFRLDGPFAFLRADPRYTGKWSDDQIRDFIRYKSVRFLCSSIDYPRYNGHYPHGTAFQELDHSYRIRHIKRLRRLAPKVQHLVYFHCFLDVRDESPRAFARDRLLLPDGQQGNYGQPHQRLFIPRKGGKFAAAVRKNVDLILNVIGADGVYWDEMEYSRYRYHYGEPWDGVSGDIDRRSFRLIRKKSSVELLSQEWRMELAREILRRGPLVANSQPHTRTMAQLHFPRFVETGSISNCRRAQLFSPIALGDHLSERSEQDAYRVMRQALMFGCLYYWYNDLLVPVTHHHLTRYMYPTTPVELHEGIVLAEERIVTVRSGTYSWADDSDHEVHVFGADSIELDPERVRQLAHTYRRDGVTYTDLRLPEAYSAAIVRRRR